MRGDEKTIGHDEALKAEFEALDLDQSGGGSALSISGGGIRSATFALGALQALASLNVLDRFDYLSTVSGGGYIGSWLTAWKHRRKGMADVVGSMARPTDGDGQECEEIRHLRMYSNYLTPRLGLISFDSWALSATVIRNMLLNWTVAVPLLMFLLMLPRIYATSIAFPEYYFYWTIFDSPQAPDYGADVLDHVADDSLVKWGLPGLAVLFFAIGLLNVLRYLPSVGGVRHRMSGYFGMVLLPYVLGVWSLDAWNNLRFIGPHYAGAPLGDYALGAGVAVVLAWTALLASQPRLFRTGMRVIAAGLVIAAVPALSAWLVYNRVLWSPNSEIDLSWAVYVTLSFPLVLFGVALGIMLFVGLTGRVLADADREWLARANGGVLLVAVGWIVLSWAVLGAPEWLFSVADWLERDHVTVASAFGAIGGAFGWAASVLGKRGTDPSGAGGSAFMAAGALKLGTTLAFLLFLVVGLALLTNILLSVSHDAAWSSGLFSVTGLGSLVDAYTWTDHDLLIGSSNPWIILTLTIVLLVTGRSAGWLININTFSLQGMYRYRLVRAYLGASNEKRNPNPFTGFDPDDDLPLHRLDPHLKPYHVVNMTLNLVGGDRLDWQQRKASSFIASALHCGNRDLGYRPSVSYGGRGGMTLGTAMATSGAAASPNMGYLSSPITTFVMTLFNARLGVWLGNPRNAKAARTSGPRTSLKAMVSEFAGLTSADGEYVYLSDGGHFENLAIYEMVARGCRDILVLDGGCDPQFSLEDLGNALRKIKVDMGVEIEFLPGHVETLLARRSRCALAAIKYSDVGSSAEDGRLIYVKPMLRGNESPAILSYAAKFPSFPHQTTTDQWFDESQTECYRQLGYSTLMEIAAGFRGGSLAALHRHILESYPDAVTGQRDAAASADRGAGSSGAESRSGS